jgi:uncharacterized protein YcbX
MIVSGIWIYPVKALQGVPLQQAQVERRGLRHDRRWMLVDESGVMITQRQVHELVRIMVRPKDGEWLLYHRNPRIRTMQRAPGSRRWKSPDGSGVGPTGWKPFGRGWKPTAGSARC